MCGHTSLSIIAARLLFMKKVYSRNYIVVQPDSQSCLAHSAGRVLFVRLDRGLDNE